METKLLKRRETIPSKIISREKVLVDMPQSDFVFFMLFADKMGWSIKNKENIWDEYIKNSPKNIPLTDENIMEEVYAVRYEKV